MKKNLSELEVEFDAVQNAPLTFDQITRGRRNSVVWTCVICGYSWPARVYNRLKGTECPRCQGTIPIPGETDLATVFPRIAGEWDYSLNPKGPEEYLPYSNHKVAWICDRGHQWKASPNNRVNGKGCPRCSGRVVDPNVNSFAVMNPLLLNQWDEEKNEPFTAWDVAAYDNRDYYWVCENGHSFPASPANRTKGTRCPYCTGKLPVVGVNDFGTVSPSVAAEWHPSKNKGLLPEHFLPYSHEEVYWLCDEGHVWKASIESRTRGSQCKKCNGRREKRSYLI